MKKVCFLTVLLFSLTVLPVYAQQSLEIEIRNFGIFTLGDSQEIKDEEGKGTKAAVVSNYKIVNQGDVITAKKGISFGYTYQVFNLPRQQVYTLTHAALIPPIKTPEGPTITENNVSFSFKFDDRNQIFFNGFTFDHDYEMVPGKWIFAVVYNGRVLAKKSFTVVTSP
ncbi:MAG: DUF3859 domain-containing protein [Deltaproteobacteria bacterium]|nr:DUF3859 domain-containing protein [Deltaproteobacteria bacterium]